MREDWSRERLNGRQIRNSMRTALVVAEQRGRKVVGAEEVGCVLKIGREFEGYLVGSHNAVNGGGGGRVGKGWKREEQFEGFEEVVRP